MTKNRVPWLGSPRCVLGGRSIAAAALAIALLTGCGDEDPTSPIQTQTQTPASEQGQAAPPSSDLGQAPITTPEPAVAPGQVLQGALPALPRQADSIDTDGALAFAQYYFEMANYAIPAGDERALRALAMPPCDRCEEIEELAHATSHEGAVVTGGVFTFAAEGASPTDSGDPTARAFTVKGRVKRSGFTVSQGGDNTSQPPTQEDVTLVLWHTNAGWSINRWQ